MMPRLSSGSMLALSLVACSLGGCSALLDFSTFSGESDGGVPPRDTNGADVPGTDTPMSDTPPMDTPGSATLMVSVTGMGMVTSDPSGISCGATCTAEFPESSDVTLTAAPASGSTFLGWSGGCTGSALTCTVTLSAATTVEAEFAVRGSVRWVHPISFSGDESFENDVVIAPDGDPIVGTTVDDGEGDDLYVAKLDRETGDVVWENHFDTPSQEQWGGMAVDDAGNVYVAVTISGFGDTFVLGGTTFTSDLSGNIAVFRLNGGTGAVEWGAQWGGSGQDRPKGVAVSGSSVYVMGQTLSSPAVFGSPVFQIAGGTNDGFLVRASTMNGGVQGLSHFDGNFRMSGIAASGSSVAVTGSFMQDADIGPCAFRRAGAGYDFFLASFASSTVSCAWVRTAGDSITGNDADGFDVAPQPDGGFVATGVFEGNALFAASGTSLGSSGAGDVFAVRYNAAGVHQWSFRFGGASSDLGVAIATMPTGETFLTGTFTDAITFGVTSLTGPSDVFVSRLGAGAAPSQDWAVALGGDTVNRTEGIAVDDDGFVYASAYFNGAANVGGTALTAAGYDNWVVALVP
jgi:hypothetical protein